MNLIWFSHFIPFPPRGGNLQRSFNLIRQMCKSYEITLVALNLHGEPAEQVDAYTGEMMKYCESVQIWELPHRWRGPRWWAELSYSPLFSAPFSCRVLFSQQNYSRWKQVLDQHRGALLHFDSIDLALFAGAGTDFRKVLNHHNCESAMACRRAQMETNAVKKQYLQSQARKLARIERSICATFDMNTVVSEQDLQLLRAIQPAARFHVVENGVDVHHFTPSSAQEEPNSLIFTGSMDWYPNISAMRFLVEKIWPAVKATVPAARLYLAGKNTPDFVLQWMKDDASIVVFPNPPDMRPLLARAAICVCPIMDGGGTRLKILDAMAMALPVISTSTGCEGLRVKDGENIVVADTREHFIDNIVRLLNDKERRHELGNAGRRLVEAEYSWERIGEQLEQAYQMALHSGTTSHISEQTAIAEH